MLSNLSELEAIPSMSSLLGSRGDQALLRQINSRTGSSYFGSDSDRYRKQYETFKERIIEPIRRANREVWALSSKLMKVDEIRELSTIEDLRDIPPCMMIPAITTEPVFNLLRQGRISAYGYTAEELEAEKVMYDRLIDRNGTIHLDDPEQFYTDEDRELRKRLSEDWEKPEEDILIFGIADDHDDPELTPEELYMLSRARRLMEDVVDTTYLDPTDIDNLRG